MFTAWCLAVVTLSVFGMGLPLCWLLAGRRPLEESDYVKAPFLGAAAIILVVQNLFYHDVKVGLAALLVWGAVGQLWLGAGRAGRPRAWWRGRPRGLLAAAALAFAVQGAGLLRLGARDYVGRAWGDQFNYTAIAQFALEEPYSLPPEAVGNRPYLIQGVRHKDSRIGAPLLQAFFAATCGADAMPLFEPTALLLPPLAVFAAFGLGRRLGLARRPALLAAAGAGLLPALAAVHLEGFLSQALGLPFLLAWPVFLADLAERPSAGRLIAAGLCAAAGHSTYAELYPLFLAAAVGLLGVAACGDRRRWRLPACAAALALAPALLNPSFVRPAWRILGGLGQTILQAVYPWAFRAEGLARLWAGDFAAWPRAKALLAAAAAAATALAYFGLLRRCAAAWRAPGGEGGPAAPWLDRAVALAALGLALVPVAVVLKDREHPYQFYKLANTVSPLLAVGLVLALRPRRPAGAGAWAGPALAAAPLALAGLASASMALGAARLEVGPRSAAVLVCGPGVGEVTRCLEEGRGRPLLVANSDAALNPWPTYFARRHRVWLAAPRLNDSYPFAEMPEFGCVADLARLPEGCLLLCSDLPWFSYGPVAGARLVRAGGQQRLWQTTTRTWAVPTHFTAPAGAGQDKGGPYFVAGPELARLEVLAICPGELAVQVRLAAPPGAPAVGRLRVRARGPGGDWEGEAGGGEIAPAWKVPLAAGTTVLTFEAAGGPAVVVRGLRLGFAATPQGR